MQLLTPNEIKQIEQLQIEREVKYLLLNKTIFLRNINNHLKSDKWNLRILKSYRETSLVCATLETEKYHLFGLYPETQLLEKLTQVIRE